MIYLTGDTHGEIDVKKLSFHNWKESRELTRNDYLIILGDFGFPFFDEDIMKQKGQYAEYLYWIHWLAARPYTILWVDGNHDNFNYWEKQPIAEMFSGKVQPHPYAENIYHLMRGEVYKIDGKTFFAFGGASSHDKQYRTPNISWWEKELAQPDEKENALNNLAKHNYNVDFILSHTVPSSVINKFAEEKIILPITDDTSNFLENIKNKTNYKQWFSGHLHIEKYDKESKLQVLYNSIMSLDNMQSN